MQTSLLSVYHFPCTVFAILLDITKPALHENEKRIFFNVLMHSFTLEYNSFYTDSSQ